MSEETKKTPQAEEPAVEPNTAEQAAPETAPEQAAAPETNAEAADPKEKGWLLQQEGPGAGGRKGKAGRG